jgi:hypothetical protein
MRSLAHAALLVLLPAAALAAPVAPMPRPATPARAGFQPGPVEATAPQLVAAKSAPFLIEVNATGTPAGAALRWQVFVKNRDGDYVLAVGKVQTRTVKVEKAFLFAGPPGEYLVLCSYAKGDDSFELKWEGTLTGGVAPPGPTPPGPKPPDPPAPPVPVTSFRVVFVYESGTNLTAAQSAVIYGKAVEAYLNATCTKEGNLPGWRRYDKDTDAANEQPTMRALWAAVKPALTTVPCVVIEVNGKADILAIDKPDGKGGRVTLTPAEALALLKKYAEGK